MRHALWQRQIWSFRVSTRQLWQGLAAGAIAGALAWPAAGQVREYPSDSPSSYDEFLQRQDEQRYSSERDQPRYSPQGDRAQPQRRDQSSTRRSSQQSSDAIFRVDPNEWVRVGYDFDRDGRIDAVEDIRASAIQQAKRNEQRGVTRQESQSDRDSRLWTQRDTQYGSRYGSEDTERRQAWDRQGLDAYSRDMRTADMRREPTREAEGEDTGQVLRRVVGTVSELQSQQLAGQDKAHMLAKLETSRGLARVDLGPETDLQKLNLKEGAEVAVVGTVGRINGRSVLMAHEIQAEKQTIQVDRPRSAGMRQFRGTIEDYRNVAFQGQDEEHVVARVRMSDGRLATVNLGAENSLQSANLQEGDEIQILARPGEINGQAALIAEELRVNDQTIDIKHADNRQRYEEARARMPQPGQKTQPQPSQPGQTTPSPGQSPSQSEQDQGSTPGQIPGQSQPTQPGSAQPGTSPDRPEQSQSQPEQPSTPSPSSTIGEGPTGNILPGGERGAAKSTEDPASEP